MAKAVNDGDVLGKKADTIVFEKKVSGNFEANLALVTRSSAVLMNALYACSVLGLRHFTQHGDTSQLQKLVDAMPKNVVRKQALFSWLRDFSPITMEQGKLVKSKTKAEDGTDWAALAKKAEDTPFWDYLPEQEAIIWDMSEFNNKLVQFVKRHLNADRMAPATEADKAHAQNVLTVVEAIASGRNVVVAATADELHKQDSEAKAA